MLTVVAGRRCAKLRVHREALNRQGRANVASYKQELERRGPDGIPSLDDIEPGKICGAVIPMSERAQTQMRDSIEVIDYLLNQERVVWS
jgi:hypothetical protein